MTQPDALPAVTAVEANDLGHAVAAPPVAPADLEPELIRERRKVPKKLIVGAVILGIFVFVALFDDVIAPHDPIKQDVVNRLADPSREHPLGTDALGRDVYSRMIHATGTDLRIGFLAALLPLILGTIIGAIAGYFGKWSDRVLMRSADLVQAFPIYIFMIALVFALGAGERSILIAFLVVAWVAYARLIRASILIVKHQDYVQAARGSGLSNFRILRRHILPNSLNQVIVYFPADILYAVLSLAAFSFLGLGIPPPTPEWGAMIADGQPYIQTQWWLVTAPGLVIVVLGIGLSLIADGLDDWSRR